MKKLLFVLCCICGSAMAQQKMDLWKAQVNYASLTSGRFVSDPIQFNGDDPEEMSFSSWRVEGNLSAQYTPKIRFHAGLATGELGYGLNYAGSVDQFIDTTNPLLAPISDILDSPLVAFINGDVDYELVLKYTSLPIGASYELHQGKWFNTFAYGGLEVFHYDTAKEYLLSTLVNNFIISENTLVRDRLSDINQWNLGVDIGIGIDGQLDQKLGASAQFMLKTQLFDIWKESNESTRMYMWGFEFGLNYRL